MARRGILSVLLIIHKRYHVTSSKESTFIFVTNIQGSKISERAVNYLTCLPRVIDVPLIVATSTHGCYKKMKNMVGSSLTVSESRANHSILDRCTWFRAWKRPQHLCYLKEKFCQLASPLRVNTQTSKLYWQKYPRAGWSPCNQKKQQEVAADLTGRSSLARKL